jgi:hypothetical protein
MLQIPDRLRHGIGGNFARESIPYCILLPHERMLVLIYSWVDGQDQGGYAVAIFEDGPEPAYLQRVDGIPAHGMDFNSWDLGGVHVAVGPDFGSAHVRYNDESCSVDVEFKALHNAFDYASNQAGCPPYQATNRYEQGGWFRGTMRWRGRTIDIDGPGHRDHSWGRRDWDAIHHYKWLAVAGEDRAANLMVALVEGETIYNGYVFVDGTLSPIVTATVETKYGDGFVQNQLTALMRDETGRSTTMDFPSRFASARWDVSPTFTFTDGCFTGTLEGGPVSAYIQYAWPKAYLGHLLNRDINRD